MIDEERWKQCHQNYEVSTHGRVRNKWTDRVLKQGLTGSKYFHVSLCLNGVVSQMMVHRLVAIAFVENPFDYPQVNHLDLNRENNYFKNLEWSTQSTNVRHANRHGVGNVLLSVEDVLSIRSKFAAGVRQIDLASEYHVSRFVIWDVVRRRKWKHI